MINNPIYSELEIAVMNGLIREVSIARLEYFNKANQLIKFHMSKICNTVEEDSLFISVFSHDEYTTFNEFNGDEIDPKFTITQEMFNMLNDNSKIKTILDEVVKNAYNAFGCCSLRFYNDNETISVRQLIVGGEVIS